MWFLRAYLEDMLATPESLKYVSCLSALSRCQKLFEIAPGLDYQPHPRPNTPAEVPQSHLGEGSVILVPRNEGKLVSPKWMMLAMGLFGAFLAPQVVLEYRESLKKHARESALETPTKELDYLQTSQVMPRTPPPKDELQGNSVFSYHKYECFPQTIDCERNVPQQALGLLFLFLPPDFSRTIALGQISRQRERGHSL